ncbi:hypothetical protein ACHMW6_00250 (plasmid) [Pseudoduganella sp. UC29_106]|uniref:hypothetical protein n=1 Tax=Pseudoduganella sp. UC29_106 TaxID=3374553 RepID=UPI00375770DC
MHVQLTRLFQNGTPLANGTRGIPAIDGDLNLSEQACPIWQRFGKQASLSRDGLRGHLVPQLFDAEVVELVENHLLLSGFEIDPSNNTSTAQLWSLVLPPGPIICLRLFDDEGRPLPRHRLAMLQPDVEGELRMTRKI